MSGSNRTRRRLSIYDSVPGDEKMWWLALLLCAALGPYSVFVERVQAAALWVANVTSPPSASYGERLLVQSAVQWPGTWLSVVFWPVFALVGVFAFYVDWRVGVASVVFWFTGRSLSKRHAFRSLPFFLHMMLVRLIGRGADFERRGDKLRSQAALNFADDLRRLLKEATEVKATVPDLQDMYAKARRGGTMAVPFSKGRSNAADLLAILLSEMLDEKTAFTLADSDFSVESQAKIVDNLRLFHFVALYFHFESALRKRVTSPFRTEDYSIDFVSAVADACLSHGFDHDVAWEKCTQITDAIDDYLQAIGDANASLGLQEPQSERLILEHFADLCSKSMQVPASSAARTALFNAAARLWNETARRTRVACQTVQVVPWAS